MKLRIDRLGDIDPLRVPLPHGTEVSTRVDRMHEGYRVKTGAVGRVTAVESGSVTVQVVGVGAIRYARGDVTPRKKGQIEFAVRREMIWRALRQNVVLQTVVGSRAWGLASEDSDTDVRGFFVLPFGWTTGLVESPTDLISVDASENYWEVDKGFRQAIRADPNTLETLFAPGATACDRLGDAILADRDAFVSAEIYGSFGRYALSQLKRLGQSLRLAEHRHLLLGCLRSDSILISLDTAAEYFAECENPKKVASQEAVLRAKEYIKQLYNSMYDQGLLESRDFDGLRAFALKHTDHKFDLPAQLRPKNAYNLLRLLATASEWLRTGIPQFEVQEPLRTELLAIKNHEIELPKVIARGEELAADLEDARASTLLPKHPHVRRIDVLLRQIREESARRWHRQEPGPFGRAAAVMPLAEWD